MAMWPARASPPASYGHDPGHPAPLGERLQDTATILNWINRGITGKIELDHFATMQLCALDPTTGSCEFSNAGHRPPLVYRRISGKVDVVEMKSVPIGVEKSSEYSTLPFSLDPGDVMLLYSDGVVEAVNEEGQQYGMQRLSAALSRVARP
jgi:sigma-B regulation protein RsbU (phosphoserine phosphatase)